MAQPPTNQMTTSQQASAPARLTIDQAASRLVGFLEGKQEQIVQLLGSQGSFDKFKSVVAMALHKTPDMLDCDPKTFVDACLACASDGLIPDGRRAALVSFNDRQAGKKVCNYMPMIRGIVECMHRTGYVKDIQQDVVYKGEPFVYKKGLNPVLEHEPQPDVRTGDQNIIWAYAVITTVTGGTYALALNRAEIDKVRAISKTDKVWKPFFAEMAKKTVLRNLSKTLPFDLDVFRREDAMYDLNKAAIPVTRTVALEHRKDDVVPPEQPETPPAPPQSSQEPQQGAKPKDDARTAPKPTPAPPVDLDDDIPPHIRDAPPIEGEVIAPPATDSQDDDDFPGDRTPALEQTSATPSVITKVMANLGKAVGWQGIAQLMTQVWARDDWAAAEQAGHHTVIYQLIMTMPEWKTADQDSIAYKRIARG